MADEPDYILEIPGVEAPGAVGSTGQERQPSRDEPRRWIGVRFRCCDVYTRIWRNSQGTAYIGYCPRCGRKVRARIGPDGIDARFFEAF